MKKKTISKKDVLAAIRNEPLTAGTFVSETEKNCPVCAVGATLRQAGFGNEAIDIFGVEFVHTRIAAIDTYGKKIEVGRENETVNELLKEGRYLHALSVKFEAQASRTGTGKRTRDTIARFVKKHFPKSILLDPRF